MRLVLLGSGSPLSRLPLEALVAAGRRPIAVVLSRPRGRGPSPGEWRPLEAPRSSEGLEILQSSAFPSAASAAWRHQIPVFEANRLAEPPAIDQLLELEPDAMLSSCFPEILRGRALRLPRLGCFNLHPSALPALRGPAPLFWLFRSAFALGGVTLHRMTASVDAGPIVAQRLFPRPDGMTRTEVLRLCAELAAELSLDLVDRLEAGRSDDRAQQPELSSTFGFPKDEDYCIDTDRPARWAFNFIQGVASPLRPVLVRLPDGTALRVVSASSYTTASGPQVDAQARGCIRSVSFETGEVRFAPEDILDAGQELAS
jgi:methionyl-tRNA formyltransferase